LAESPENPEKHELLNPKNDFLFKKLFAAPGNEDLLIDMLKDEGAVPVPAEVENGLFLIYENC